MSLPAAELESIRARFVDVGRTLVAPSVLARDRNASFDRKLWQGLAQAGLFRLDGVARRAAALEGLTFGSLDLGLAVTACAHFVVVAILERFGSTEQQASMLPKLLDGTWLAACANAEPGAGTDLMGLKSRARAFDGGYLLSSRKRSITNLGACDLALVSARLQDVPAREAVNVFAVQTHGPQRWMRQREDLMGLRTSPTGNLLLRRAPVPPSSLVGPRGSGVKLFRAMFSEERVTTGFLYLGALKACLERGLRHAERRQQFGQPIGKNQYVQDKLVRMRMAAELLEAQLWRTVERYEAGEDVHASLSIVKVHGVEAATTAAQDLVRLLGSRGVSRDEPAERLLRDLLGLSILGGTVELQKIVIYNETARMLHAPQPAPAAPAAVQLDVVEASAVAAPLEAELVALVAATHPDEPSLRGRWSYDTPPDRIVTARVHDALVGVRTLVDRIVVLGGREVRVVGVGVAVKPGADVEPALLERAVAEAQARGADLLVSFLLPRSDEGRLRDAGFKRLDARVTYLERKSGALVEERMPCFVRELSGGALVEEVEARGELHLGAGTW